MAPRSLAGAISLQCMGRPCLIQLTHFNSSRPQYHWVHEVPKVSMHAARRRQGAHELYTVWTGTQAPVGIMGC